jgi:hypothetical protein
MMLLYKYTFIEYSKIIDSDMLLLMIELIYKRISQYQNILQNEGSFNIFQYSNLQYYYLYSNRLYKLYQKMVKYD